MEYHKTHGRFPGQVLSFPKRPWPSVVMAFWLMLFGMPLLLTGLYLAWLGQWMIVGGVVTILVIGKLCSWRGGSSNMIFLLSSSLLSLLSFLSLSPSLSPSPSHMHTVNFIFTLIIRLIENASTHGLSKTKNDQKGSSQNGSAAAGATS